VSYYPGMKQSILVTAVALTAALAGVPGATVASAEPPPPCSFTLSAPEVTDTLGPAACGLPAGPSISVVCLQQTGVDPGATCTTTRGTDPAQITLPYKAGGTYASSGRGCPSWIGSQPAQWCTILGPYTATL
jgi:hypothetical protein